MAFLRPTTDDAIGKYEVRKLTTFRRLLAEPLDAIPPSQSMLARLELDITEPGRQAIERPRRHRSAGYQPAPCRQNHASLPARGGPP